MAAKNKAQFGTPHSAGIFADLSVDGPDIGTLVAVIDRARNLPNRKTIGKQDPYCAARLGKEAKKTATDVRGGQTPRWDQELRFKVHDSPDYYQLKISVFTDDKRTDLIGEAWIDLKSIIVPGGGQNDIWQTLNCRGKYAGEIRMEITYYDTRPKPEKPVAKPRAQPALADQDGPAGSVRQRATGPRRRPLPSDPVTGEAPAPAPVSAPAAQPPAPGSAPPATSAAGPRALPGQQDPYQITPRGHERHASHPAYAATQPAPVQAQPPPQPIPQPIEYQAQQAPPQPRYQPQEYAQPPPQPVQQMPEPRRQPSYQMDPYENAPRHYDDRDYRGLPAPAPQQQQIQQAPPPSSYYTPDPRGQPLPEHYDHMPPQAPAAIERPPPPPAHRSSIGASAAPDPAAYRNSYDPHAVQKAPAPMPMRHDVLRTEAHRHSMSAAYPPSRPAFRAYDPAPAALPPPQAQSHGYEQPPPPLARQHTYDAMSYEPPQRPLQATVEDAPESPVVAPYGHAYSRSAGSRMHHPDDMGYDRAAAPPMPVSTGHSPAVSPLRRSPSREPERYDEMALYQQPPPTAAAAEREYSTSPGRGGFYQQPQANSSQYSFSGSPYEAPAPSRAPLPPAQQAPPDLPAALVPGIDPSLSQELADRINEDRRYERRYTTQMTGTPPRGRQALPDPSQQYADAGSPYGYSTPPQHQHHAPTGFERRSPDVTYSSDPQPPRRMSHSPSPAPPTSQQRIKRKSVSPAPPPAEERRLSDVPFSPDSFDAFNANAPSVREEANGKIVMYDGREVDPSDHLPIESWAPEPEPKPPGPTQQSNKASPARPSPSGAQPMPPTSGRRQLRIAARPASSSAAVAPPPTYSSDPHTPPAAGRNRLHKKSRPSQAALPAPAGIESSPLTPISPGNYQERQSPYGTPTRAARGNSYSQYAAAHEYPNENYHPQQALGYYGGGSPGHAPGGALPPPIPAKEPMYAPVMSGGNGEVSLAAEMSRIDLGSGPSRRRGGY